MSWWPFDQLRDDGVVPIGRPIANTRLHVLDAANRTVPISVKGHLHIGGIQVGEGYLGNPALTAERFVTLTIDGRTERVYRTGDIARWLGDGQVKLRGMRIELSEIEARARSHPLLEEAVAQVDGTLAQQQLYCHVVAKHGTMIADKAAFIADLKSFMAQSLPLYIQDCQFMLLDAMPVSPNGKVDRQALPRPATIETVAAIQPANAMEHAITAIWADNLGIPVHRIDATANFFEIGGNSLMSVAVQTDIRRITGLDPAIADIFENPTIQLLARHLTGRREHSEDRSAAVRDGRSRLLQARSRSQRHHS